jgi:hypothetical protein
VGVAAPMAFFPFSGWKDSFFGDLHAQGRDAIEFYTKKRSWWSAGPKNGRARFKLNHRAYKGHKGTTSCSSPCSLWLCG